MDPVDTHSAQDQTERIRFRPLTEDDFPQMHAWLNDPGVVRWWEGEDVSWDAVVRDYGDAREDQSTEHWIAVIDGQLAGWISCWPVSDESAAEETAPWFERGVERTAAGIDYLVGDPAVRGQGIGTAMIRAFSFDVVFGRHCDWTQAAASPYRANAPSCRALEKAGFTNRGDILYPEDEDEGPCTLFVLDRPQNQ